MKLCTSAWTRTIKSKLRSQGEGTVQHAVAEHSFRAIGFAVVGLQVRLYEFRAFGARIRLDDVIRCARKSSSPGAGKPQATSKLIFIHGGFSIHGGL